RFCSLPQPTSIDRNGMVRWSAYNSRTGQSIHRIPEAQMRSWIEQSHR
ncbi:MAG: hypothetical protein HC866_25570, partial [Leptolyngbyaceae cyanobacterium RU_5_1]|nr:hypothetical protein [Leptolyngbyaceae cyanobacterium RU_5_1]